MAKLRFAACIFALCCSLSSLHAQKTARPNRASDDAFTQEVNRYVLTDANFKKFVATQNNLEALLKRNPSLKQRYENADVLGNITNFDQGAAKLDSQFPEFAAEVHKAGFSSREYLVFTMSLFQSAMYSGLRKQGYAAKLPPEINQANIAFVDRHAAEIEQLSPKKDKNKEDKDDQDKE